MTTTVTTTRLILPVSTTTDEVLKCDPTTAAVESRDGRDAVVSPVGGRRDVSQAGTRPSRSTGQIRAVSRMCGERARETRIGPSSRFYVTSRLRTSEAADPYRVYGLTLITLEPLLPNNDIVSARIQSFDSMGRPPYAET